MNVLVFSGSGISADSGIPTFRASDGLWANHKIEDVATPEAFHRDPEKVWEFYRARWKAAQTAQPNAGHYALAHLEEYCTVNNIGFHILTQNIDGLHQRAGSRAVIELHGSIRRFKCGGRLGVCDYVTLEDEWLSKAIPICPKCLSEYLRPDIVWFNEQLRLQDIQGAYELSKDCSKMLVVGTSMQVYPAADVVFNAYRWSLADVYEFNITQCLGHMDPGQYKFFGGTSTETLPGFVKDFTRGKYT